MPAPTIDPEFHDLIPPLTADERQHLEANIAAEGCRDPIVTWGGVVVDGHNRLEICGRLGVPFRTVEREFRDRHAAVEWIIRNQLGRRNVSDYVRTALALRLKPVIESKAKENQTAALKKGDGPVSMNSTKREKVDTRHEIAKAAGVSEDTVRKVEVIEKEAPAPVKEAVARGEKSINAAFKEVRPPKPKAEPKPAPEPAGKSRVNGVVTHDPPDIAALRANGKIHPDVVVEVSDPEPATEPAAEPAPEPELGDAEWLETLPARAKLGEGLRRHFDADALCYRRLAEARKAFAYHAARLAKGNGAYARRVRSFLRLNGPDRWLVCPAPEHGGCGGTGQLPVIGECPRCNGKGYWING